MIKDLLIFGVMLSIIYVIFFIFVMFAQKIFIMLLKTKNKFLRWIAILIAIIVVAMGMNMLWGAIFYGFFSYIIN